MNQPELYRQYTAEEAKVLFGADGVAFGRHWIVAPEVVLCFVDLGDNQSDSSYFETASTFWCAVDAVDDRGFPLVPEPVRANRKPKVEAWLFARWRDRDTYMYLGNLGQTYQGMRSRTGAARAQFPVMPAIPWRILADIKGEPPSVRDFSPVAAALERLTGLTTARDRFEILQELVE